MPSAGIPLRPSFVRSTRSLRAPTRIYARAIKAIREEDANETSPPHILASGCGRCRAPGHLALRLGTSLSDAAGAHHRPFSCRPGNRHHRAAHGQSLLERLGQPFVIENRTGAGGNIGTENVVRATPDGYTLLFVGLSNAMNATLYKKLNFNFIRDIAPVASIGGAPYVMVINPSVPAKTVPEFIAYAKAVRARSTWHRPAAGPRPMSSANGSR